MQEEVTGLTEAVSTSTSVLRKSPPVFFDVTTAKYQFIVTFSQIIIRLLSRVLMRFFYRLQVTGRENARVGNRPVLIISNHKSYFDPLIISESVPLLSPLFPIRFIAKDSLFDKFISRIFFLAIGCFPAYYGQGIEKSLQTPSKILSKSGTVVFFPEGKCIRGEELGAGRIGTALLALKHPDILILPIAINNSYKVMRGGFLSRPLITSVIGKHFFLQEKLSKHQSSSPEEVVNILMKEISSLYSQIR